MKAIKTRYLGPTNVKGARISATATGSCRIIISWNYALDAKPNHEAAAKALCDKYNWQGSMICGALENCYVHVFTE